MTTVAHSYKPPRSMLSALIWVLLLILLSSVRSHAGVQPSFRVDDCAWHSTDIIVATEGDSIDGNLTVQEVWKGDMKPGDTLSVPELASFAPQEKRTIAPEYRDKAPDAPASVTGSRMILYLQKPQTPQGRWKPASMWGEMETSVNWIERGKVYAILQVDNPGPSMLVEYFGLTRQGPVGQTEQALRDDVMGVCRVQTRLQTALDNPNLMLRAQGLEPFLHSSVYFARETAFSALSHGGRPALLVLRRMLLDKLFTDQRAEVAKAMGAVGGNASGPDLMGLVASELAFWRKAGPPLQPGWWNGAGLRWAQVGTLRSHYDALCSALTTLAKVKYHGDTQVVSDLRDFWRSCPQLDGNEPSQIIGACDNLLNEAHGK